MCIFYSFILLLFTPPHSVRLIFDVTLLSLMHPMMTARRQADGIIPFSLLPDPSLSSRSWQDCAATTQANMIEQGIAISAPSMSPLDPDRQAGLSIFSITFIDLPSINICFCISLFLYSIIVQSTVWHTTLLRTCGAV